MVKSSSKSDKNEKSITICCSFNAGSIKVNTDKNFRYKGTVRVGIYIEMSDG